MNVLENRYIDKTIVLGCGKSILDLTKDEIDYINHCNVVIAMNKYMAFYKKIGIIPTHVYFLDDHENSRKFLEYIFKICKEDYLENLTFIVNKSIQTSLYTSKLNLLYLITTNTLKDFFDSFRLTCIRHFFLNRRRYIPKLLHNQYQYIYTEDWLQGKLWAHSLHEKLFHFRGSLTSVLNYCTITTPGKDIFLVGNDFNGSEYFFEDELSRLPFDWKDWTTETTKRENKHFSFINYQGTTMQDAFPFILAEMNKRKNTLYCTNSESLLVKKCGVRYKALLSH